MASDHDRIKTTHIGSLPRPAELLEYVASSTTGEQLSGENIEDLIASATERVVRKQAEIGIDIANNGEQSRSGFHLHLTDRLEGFGAESPAPFWADINDYPVFAEEEFSYPKADPETGAPLRPSVVSEISYAGEAAAKQEIAQFEQAVEAVDHDFDDLFMTSPSPGIIAGSLPNEYYESYESYVFALSEAIATEWEIIADAGLLLQIDSPELLHTHHRTFPPGQATDLDDFDSYSAIVSMYVDAINEALAGVQKDRVRLHTCWGNYDGPHHRDVELERVLEELLELDVGGLSIELSGPRHEHEFQAFAQVDIPADIAIIPGVIDVKSNVIDHPETVAMRLERVADVVGPENEIIAAPDCGFGTLSWSAAADDIVWAKLESLVEGAVLASR